MKHAALATLALLYWPAVGQGHTWPFVTVMLAAIYHDWRRAHEAPAADR